MPVMPAYLFQPQQLISSHLDAPSSAAASLHARYTHIRLCVCVHDGPRWRAVRAVRSVGRHLWRRWPSCTHIRSTIICVDPTDRTAVRSVVRRWYPTDGSSSSSTAHTKKQHTRYLCDGKAHAVNERLFAVRACLRACRACERVRNMEDGGWQYTLANR